jgi:hypothetical protein
VIFDYFTNEFLCEMKIPRRIGRVIGESLNFGIDEGQVEPFLTQRGFRDVRNADAAVLGGIYLTGPDSGRKMLRGAAIASARVNKAGV